jgi:predicted outer membrane repeat protein
MLSLTKSRLSGKTLFFIFIFLSSFLYATIINVPTPYATIQAGIDAASNTDTVLVQPGTYVENINFNGKLITVGSLFLTTQDTTYISSTYIDGNSSGRVITFNNGENSSAVLCGFTIINGLASGGYPANCGGGIFCYNYSSPILQNVTISGNYAIEGGGIYCDGSSPILQNVTITGNSADYGGGIYCYSDSNPSLENVTITGNSAESGGGIFCYNYSSPILQNVTISGNYAIEGGGIYCYSSSPSLQNVTITGNSATSCGGGIYCYYYSSPNLQNATISGNSADYYGGGIYCDYYSSPSLENVTITGNSADYGGGIYCYSSSPSLQNVTITDNSAAFEGGGIYCKYSSLSFDSVNRCNIFLNFAGSGCDLYADNCSNIDVIVDTFTIVQPDDYFAYPIDNFTFDILNAKIEQVDQDLYVSPGGSDDNSGLTVNDPLLTVSYALAKILADSTNTLTIHLSNGTYSPSQTGERFSLNCRSYVSLLGEDNASTILDGEGLSGILMSMNDNNFFIENMTIQNGSAPLGGGIYCESSSPSLENVTISGNYDTWAGGGIYCEDSSLSLENVTISGNSANYGGGIYCYGSLLVLINSIMWNDSPQEIYIDTGSVTATYSDIEGGWTGTGNINADPLFMDPGNNNYYLLYNSPCIDAGDPSSPLDPDGTIAEMGAFYFDRSSGALGSPTIIAVTDVPDDQGRYVQVLWNRSPYDTSGSPNPIESYSVWRYDDIFDDRGIFEIYEDPWEIFEKAAQGNDKNYYWQRDDEILTFITQLPAMGFIQYSVVSPTLIDSSVVSINYSAFKVFAHTDITLIYFPSIPDSGYSVDNIAPDETRVYIAQNGSNIGLSWDEVEYGTFQGNSYPEVNGRRLS